MGISAVVAKEKGGFERWFRPGSSYTGPLVGGASIAGLSVAILGRVVAWKSIRTVFPSMP